MQTILVGFALAFGLALAFALGLGALKLLFSALTPVQSPGSSDGLPSLRNAGDYLDAEKEA